MRKQIPYKNYHHMQESRKTLLSRISHCENCRNTKRKLFLHHLDLSRENHSVENLKLFCHSCHMKFHKNERKERRLAPKMLMIRKKLIYYGIEKKLSVREISRLTGVPKSTVHYHLKKIVKGG